MTILQSCIETDNGINFIAESVDEIDEEITDLYTVSIAANSYVNENLFEFIGEEDSIYDVYENIKAFSAAHMLIAFEADEAGRESMSRRLLKGGTGIAALGGAGYVGHKYGDNIAAGAKAATQASMNAASTGMSHVKDTAATAAKHLGNTVDGVKAKVGEVAHGIGDRGKDAITAVASKTKAGADVVKSSLGNAKAAVGDVNDGVKDQVEANM